MRGLQFGRAFEFFRVILFTESNQYFVPVGDAGKRRQPAFLARICSACTSLTSA